MIKRNILSKSILLISFLLSLTFQAYADSEKLVVVYGTSWCGHCKNARAYLTSQNVEFTEYDIETSEIGAQKFQALNGYGVPLIYVGSERIEGFKKAQLESALISYGLILSK